MGTRKVKNSTREVKIWICCTCKKKDVDIVKYTEKGSVDSTFAPLDSEDEDVLD